MLLLLGNIQCSDRMAALGEHIPPSMAVADSMEAVWAAGSTAAGSAAAAVADSTVAVAAATPVEAVVVATVVASVLWIQEKERPGEIVAAFLLFTQRIFAHDSRAGEPTLMQVLQAS